MPKDRPRYLSMINQNAIKRKLSEVSNPNVLQYFPEGVFKEFNSQIDDAFQCEYGFTFRQFTACIHAVESLGAQIEGTVKRCSRQDVISRVAEKLEISATTIERIIAQITLCQREDFLIPPSPYERYDVYPWRFNRELSFNRRPIIQYQGDLIWGNLQLNRMWTYVVDLMISGKYKARSAALKQLIGKLSDKRGDEFNSAVAHKLATIKGVIVQEKVSKINGKKIVDSQGNVLGDIDVLCIIPQQSKIIVGEVKDFSFAKNPYEMSQEYNRIFVDGKKPCFLTKHKRRASWIQEHLDDVIAHFDLPKVRWSVRTVMFVSEEIISNEFYHKNESIIVYSKISEQNVKLI